MVFSDFQTLLLTAADPFVQRMMANQAIQGHQDWSGFGKSHDGPIKVLILGHSFVAGFKEFQFEDLLAMILN